MIISNFVPAYDHIVVAVEENHSFSEIVGNGNAPYINALAQSGALYSNYHGVAHPSEPNYFALYAGSTFGITDDRAHSENGKTLGSILSAHDRSFIGYVEVGSPRKHNPWESFSEGSSVESSMSNFPTNFSHLPTVAFVIPSQNDDMHGGTIARADTWLKSKLDSYAQWATRHNSLLVVTFDESDGFSGSNQVATILFGAHIKAGVYAKHANHYDLLHTILRASGLNAPNNAANAVGIDGSAFANSPPRILDSAGPQTISGGQTTTPFAHLAVTDIDVGQTLTVKVRTGNGTLSNPGTGTFDASNGTYTFSGTASKVTSALHGLVFSPSPNRVPPGESTTNIFKISVTDGTASAASDVVSLVVNY